MAFCQKTPGIKKKKNKKNKKEGLMFWNISLKIMWNSLSVELSSGLIRVKVF